MRDYWSPSERPLADYHQRGSSTQKYPLDWCRFWHRSGVDAYVDMQSNQAIQTTLQFYIALSLVYVSPGDNLTDVPSRVPYASVWMLSPRVWKEIENSWGPHSIYLIALDSNSSIAAQGCRLIYFSLCPTKGSAGIIVFSQTFHRLDNSYFFPNLSLRAGLALRFLAPQPFPFTFVASDPHPVITGGLLSRARYWFCPPRYFVRPHRAFIYYFRQCIPLIAFTLGHLAVWGIFFAHGSWRLAPFYVVLRMLVSKWRLFSLPPTMYVGFRGLILIIWWVNDNWLKTSV